MRGKKKIATEWEESLQKKRYKGKKKTFKFPMDVNGFRAGITSDEDRNKTMFL